MKLLNMLIILSFFTIEMQAQLAFQGFEGTPADDWSYTPNPAAYNIGGDDVWDIVSSLGPISPVTGSSFWGIRDIENQSFGGDHFLTFASVDVSGEVGVIISFKYYTEAWDTGDELEYEAFFDGASQGQVTLNNNTGAWTTVNINVPDAVNSVSLTIIADQDGGGDYGGLDDFAVTSAGSCGITGLSFVSAVCNSNTPGPGNDTYDLTISYTGTDPVATVVNNSGSGTVVNGDTPGELNGTDILITGISENDNWDISLSGNCFNFSLSGTAPTCDPLPNVGLSCILMDPPGTDTDFEYIELKGDPSLSLNNIWFLSIDGDNTRAGEIVEAINLSSFSLGSNGCLIIQEDGTVNYTPPVAPATTLVDNGATTLENGTSTSLLVTNFTGSVGTDIDTDNDGVADLIPWGAVIDAVAAEDGGTFQTYTFGVGVTIPRLFGMGAPITAMALCNNSEVGSWIGVELTGASNPGPYTFSNAWNASGTDILSSLSVQILLPGCAQNLPVELSSFEASWKQEDVLLEWQTLTETDNDYFLIEYSRDGIQFETIGRQEGAGTTQEPQFYAFLHQRPGAETNYYRLKQVDLDGAFAYSDVEIVRKTASTDHLWHVFPNPVSDQFNLRRTTPLDGDTDITIFNSLGQAVRSLWMAEEQDRIELDVSALAPGQYLLVIQNGRSTESIRWIKGR
jgi:hypothetical protein